MEVIIYGSPTCMQCKAALSWFRKRGVEPSYTCIASNSLAADQLRAHGVKQLPYVCVLEGGVEKKSESGFRPDLYATWLEV